MISIVMMGLSFKCTVATNLPLVENILQKTEGQLAQNNYRMLELVNQSPGQSKLQKKNVFLMK